MQGNTQELYDIYSVWHVPFWQTAWFTYTIVALLIVVIVVGAIVWYWRRYYPVADYRIVIEKKLRLLLNKQYESKEEIKHTYYLLTELLKEFLGTYYACSLRDKTDSEVVAVLKKQAVAPFVIDRMQEIEQAVLMIKFANMGAARESVYNNIQASISLIRDLIRATDHNK